MKKVISAFLILVLCIIAVPTEALANSVIVDDTPLGVITDADGNVVEVIPTPRDIPSNGKYVDSIYTIPKGGSLTTYQYQPKEYFEFGFAYYAADDKTVVTTRGGRMLLQLYKSSTIGGTRELDYEYEFSTSYEEQFPHDTYDTRAWAFLNTMYLEFDEAYPYYNGKYVNKSDKAISLRVFVIMDPQY